VNEKCTAKPTEGKLHQGTIKKILYEHSPSAAWSPSYGLLMVKENAQNVHLNFPCRHCRR
jgi:hypothetical protein